MVPLQFFFDVEKERKLRGKTFLSISFSCSTQIIAISMSVFQPVSQSVSTNPTIFEVGQVETL